MILSTVSMQLTFDYSNDFFNLETNTQATSSSKAWLTSIDVVDMSPEKVVQFGKYVQRIYEHEKKDDQNCVSVKDIQVANIIPGLSLETRKKFSKELQCKHFLKVSIHFFPLLPKFAFI